MKKRMMLLAILACCVLGGCGDKKAEKDASTKEPEVQQEEEKSTEEEKVLSVDDFDYKDYVTLGDYKGFEVEVPAVTVTEEEVQAELKALAERNAVFEASDKANVEAEDWVNVTAKVFDGEKEVSGYNLSNQELQVGAGEYLDEFEKGLVGLPVGAETDLNVTMADDYYDSAVAGKTLVFKTTINSIGTKVTPEVTDEWVKSLGEYENLDACKAAIKVQLEESGKEQQQTILRQSVQQTVVSNCTFQELPEELVKSQMDVYMKEDTSNAESLGMELVEFISQYYGYTDEVEYKTDLKAYIEESIRMEFALRAIKDVEKITITDEDFNTFVQECIEYYGFTDKEELMEYYGEDVVNTACSNDKIWDTVCSLVTMVENPNYGGTNGVAAAE